MSDTTPRSKTDPNKTGAAKIADAQSAEIQAVKDTDPTSTEVDIKTAGVGSEAVVVEVEDGVADSVYQITATTEMVTLDRDIVEKFYFPDTTRPSYRLLYVKGQTVPRTAIEAYNASVEQANLLRSNGGVDPANPAGVDSTTLASGTNSHLAQGAGK